MTQKSTAIVRARVTGSHAGTAAEPTSTRTSSSRCWKPGSRPDTGTTEVAVPGGVVNGIRQIVAGAPELKPGQEYVLFLWTSRSGLTQVIGLSQGLFKLSEEGSEGGRVSRWLSARRLRAHAQSIRASRGGSCGEHAAPGSAGARASAKALGSGEIGMRTGLRAVTQRCRAGGPASLAFLGLLRLLLLDVFPRPHRTLPAVSREVRSERAAG